MARSFAQLTSLFKRNTDTIAYDTRPDSYEYSPLDEAHEIRLLTLLPGRFSDDIHIHLRTERLTATQIPKYEALSYVWGSTEGPKTIFVGAHEQPRQTLAVTRNLAQALRYLRLKDNSRVLWIDAICINQADLVERSKQVKRMADIYCLASRVVVWLGEEKEKSAVALRAFEQVNSKVAVDFAASSAKAVSHDPSEQHWADISKAPPFTKEQWLAISSLLARPWFERLWIWQEAHLANQKSVIMCGLVEISWSAFCSSAVFLSLKPYSHHVEAKGYRENVQRAADLCNREIKDFRALAEKTQLSKCADPRDRVYALLSMLAPGFRINLEPDYTQDVSEVYRNLFILNVERFQVLDLLTSCEYHHVCEESTTMPSWAPDWSTPKLSRTLTYTRAASSTNSETTFIGTRIMAATGLLVSTISQLHSINLSKYPSYMEIVGTIKMLAKLLKLEGPSHTSESNRKFDAFIRTMNANMFSDRSNPVMDYLPHSKDGFGAIQWALTVKYKDIPEPPENFARYFALVPFWLRGRSLFMTEAGAFGLVPQAAREGDSLVVLSGCPSPMVLRSTADGQSQVIGEAFDLDFVDGEALLGHLPEDVRASFRLFQGTHIWCYMNSKTNKVLDEDPRLGPLPAGWQSELACTRTPYSWFWNDELGIRPSVQDPRVTPEALRKRGVPLRTFRLV